MEMVSTMPDALLSHNRSEILHRDETELWDYKEDLLLDSPFKEAQFAKDVLGFMNAKGGVIIVGVSDEFRLPGVVESHLTDTSRLLAKVRKYTGPKTSVFQDSLELANHRYLWLIFIKGRTGEPIPVQANGPMGKEGQPVIRKGEYYLRVHDEVKPCREAADYARLFSGYSQDNLHAYAYEVDEPYFRLLAPDCDRFIGREKLIQDVHDALRLRHPIVALDGVGGVGKTAIAIEAVRQSYDAKEYQFIVSLSAKSKVWHQQVITRQAAFSGISELIQEIARVLNLEVEHDIDELRSQVVKDMAGIPGLLLIDNIEDIDDPEVAKFISEEVPDPVKVLVTSRVDKGLGAKTVSVPEMDDSEARALLFHELRKVGFLDYMKEPDEISNLLEVTGKVPLAIRWAAALASNRKTLRDVYRQVRQSNTSNKEFLNFCFSTMYDVLPQLTRNVALLCPFLQEEWNAVTLSIALDAPISSIENSIRELKDRGILLASGPRDEAAVRLLPLTMDFFAGKWHENARLQEKVMENLSAALASNDREGLLFSWPVEKRIGFLKDRIMDLIDGKDYERANKLTSLALRWSSDDPELLFLQGRIAYENKKINRGLDLMSLGYTRSDGDLPHEWSIYFGKAMLDHGHAGRQIDGLIALKKMIPMYEVDESLIDDYCSKSLQSREFSFIRELLEISKDHNTLIKIIRSIWPYLDDGNVIYQLGRPLADVLTRLSRSKEAFEISQSELREKAERVGTLLDSVSH
jgi:hypothetical protein